MSIFIKSQNTPIFGNFLGTGAPNTGNQFFLAKEASFSTDVQLEPNKVFGSPRISNDYGISGPQIGKFSMNVYPFVGSNSVTDTNNQLALITGLAQDFISGNQILFGNFLLKQCYLSTLNIQISPQEPITVKADFDVYNLSNITGISFTGANIQNLLTTNGSGAYLESLHALAVGISGSGVNLPQSKTDIEISTTCSRTPVYDLGSIYPSTVILENIGRQTSIKGENIGQIINHSGGYANLNLKFNPFSSFITGGSNFSPQTELFNIGITGRVNSQALSASTDNGLIGAIIIQENIY